MPAKISTNKVLSVLESAAEGLGLNARLNFFDDFLTSSEEKRFKTQWVETGFDHGKIEGKSFLLFFIPTSKCSSQIQVLSDLTFSVALRIKTLNRLHSFSSLNTM